jgi:DNA-3-methyladenine glycosylase I
MTIIRCGWVSNDVQYQNYHDEVWGVPDTDNVSLFAKLCLDGQQAGLSWLTILRKQAAYEKAFYNFDPSKVAAMTTEDVDRLVLDKSIIRSRQKINAIITNAKAYLEISERMAFKDFIWSFVDHKTLVNHWQDLSEVPTSTSASRAMAKALKQAGFKYVGETICYAFMQAVGMVNDHLVECHCYDKVCKLAR